jgi:GT2 family glycosyltransferase
MKASIIIATYNRPQYITGTIAMALRQRDVECEVIVVDQTKSYEPDTLGKLNAMMPEIVYVRHDTPNVAEARNVGLKLAKASVIIFIDDDVEFDENLVAGHVLAHDQAPGAGAVVGLIVQESWENRQLELASGPAKYESIGPPDSFGRYVIKWVPTGNTSYKRTALESVGGFDPLLKSYCEDADVSVRVRSAGFELLYDPSIELLHLAASSGGCDHRNTTVSFDKESERVWSALYFVFKNRFVIGRGPVIKTIISTFRQFVMNRSIVSSGPVSIMRRGYSFASMFVDVVSHTIRLPNRTSSLPIND